MHEVDDLITRISNCYRNPWSVRQKLLTLAERQDLEITEAFATAEEVACRNRCEVGMSHDFEVFLRRLASIMRHESAEQPPIDVLHHHCVSLSQ